MNDAASAKVEQEKQAKVRDAQREKRKEAEKANHRASMLYLQGQKEVFDTLAKHHAENPPVEEDDDDEGGMKEYDEKTDGPYRQFYWKHHKPYLDQLQSDWKQKNKRSRKPSKV